MRFSFVATVLVSVSLLVSVGCSDDPESCYTCQSGGAGGEGGSAGPTGDIAATVTRYDYAFDLVTGAARSKLTLDVGLRGDCYGVSCRTSEVADAVWNEAAATSSTLASDRLEVCGPGVDYAEPLTVGASTTVEEATHLPNLDVGFSRKKDLAGGEFSYLLSWVGGCDWFGPCDPDPSRMSTFHFDVTHPEGAVVLCPGKLTPGATMTSCEVENAPSYSAFAIASDPLWERKPFGTFQGVDFVFYETPLGGIASSLDAASVKQFVDWAKIAIGPLPYGNELRIAGAPTAWLGFEHPANIILHEQLDKLQTSYANTAMHVLMHEIVHQWAGDRTTIASDRDFVWKEAIAEYIAYVFEDLYRPEGEAKKTRDYWHKIALQAKYWPRPIDVEDLSVEDFYGDVYGAGPMTLFVQLEALITRNKVLDGIKLFLSTPGPRSVDDLREALEEVSGEGLYFYFDSWVNGFGTPDWPTFDVEVSSGSGKATVFLTQHSASGKSFPCVVEVDVIGPTQTVRVPIMTMGSGPSTASVPFGESVVSHTFDPEHRVLARETGVQPLQTKHPVWIF